MKHKAFIKYRSKKKKEEKKFKKSTPAIITLQVKIKINVTSTYRQTEIASN